MLLATMTGLTTEYLEPSFCTSCGPCRSTFQSSDAELCCCSAKVTAALGVCAVRKVCFARGFPLPSRSRSRVSAQQRSISFLHSILYFDLSRIAAHEQRLHHA